MWKDVGNGPGRQAGGLEGNQRGDLWMYWKVKMEAGDWLSSAEGSSQKETTSFSPRRPLFSCSPFTGAPDESV